MSHPLGATHVERHARPSATVWYEPRLDGLRALAVMAVFFAHAPGKLLPGGPLGVDVFFVLSGYLITRNLAASIGDGSFRLLHFYERRARRLLPALLLLGVGALAIHAVFPTLLAVDGPLVILSALTYSTNYVLAYLAPFEVVHPFAHLWSLAVEEHFYLLYPVALAAALNKLGTVRTLRWHVYVIVTVVLARAAIAVVLAGEIASGDHASVYYPTHLRIDGLLMGCALALLTGIRPNVVRRLGHPGLAWAAIAILVAAVRLSNAWQALYYVLVLPVVGLAVAVLLARLDTTRPGEALRVLGAKPLVWLGRRSYGFYLFHAPLIVVVRRGLRPYLADLPGPLASLAHTHARTALALIVSLVACAVSYRFVELPWLRRRRVARATEAPAAEAAVAEPTVAELAPADSV